MGVYQGKRIHMDSIGQGVTKRHCIANFIHVGIVPVSPIPNPIGKIMAKMARHQNISQCVMSCYHPWGLVMRFQKAYVLPPPVVGSSSSSPCCSMICISSSKVGISGSRKGVL